MEGFKHVTGDMLTLFKVSQFRSHSEVVKKFQCEVSTEKVFLMRLVAGPV
jgi:hypothetical protein